MSAPATMIASDSSPPETLTGMAISLGFWCCLLVSAGLFGGVALAPKIQSYLQLRLVYESNQSELVTLERQANRLQRVIDAMRNDKQFASEMTRIELDTVQPGEEVLPVNPELKLDSTNPIDAPPPEISRDWYAPIIDSMATDSHLRSTILAVAAALVVVSFTVLQPAGTRQTPPETCPDATIWQCVKGRYVHRN